MKNQPHGHEWEAKIAQQLEVLRRARADLRTAVLIGKELEMTAAAELEIRRIAHITQELFQQIEG